MKGPPVLWCFPLVRPPWKPERVRGPGRGGHGVILLEYRAQMRMAGWGGGSAGAAGGHDWHVPVLLPPNLFDGNEPLAWAMQSIRRTANQ